MVKVPTEMAAEIAAAPRWFSKFLKGTFDHYSATVFTKVPFLLRLFFRWLFGKVLLSDSDAARLKALGKKGTIIYVIRNRSRLEYLMLYWVFSRRDLPAPVFSHYISIWWWQSLMATFRRGISRVVSFAQTRRYPNPYENGYVAALLADRVATVLPARYFYGLPWRFSRKKNDPLADIIRIRQQKNLPIYLLPIEFAYGRRPDREVTGATDLLMGTKVTPSSFRQGMMTLRNRGDITILLGEPMSLEQEVEEASILAPKTAQRDNEIAYTIRTRCIQRINRERRVVLGPVLKSRSEMIEQVLHDPEIFTFLQDLSKNDEKDFIDLRRDARKMLEEMAADYNPTTVRVVVYLLKKAFGRLYVDMEIDLDQLDKVRMLAREMPVVYIPCHKSHMDYLILSYLLYQNHMSVPYIVAGVNLNFWPLGPIFRGGGAFFMRRSFRGKRLYSKIFAKYTEYLVRENIPIEFFIEGTRSRTGKIILPRLGFLSILLEAVEKADKSNLCIVPVSINYEHIFEKRFYLNEAKGKTSEGENIGTMIRNRKMIGKKQGRMYLQMAEPFTLRELLWQAGSKIPEDRDALMELASNMAYRVAHQINRHSIATPFAVVAASLLALGKKGLYLWEIKAGVSLILNYLRSIDVRIVGEQAGWIENMLGTMEKEKMITKESEDEEDPVEPEDAFYFLEEDKRLDLTIYKNLIVHHYQFVSLLSMCFLAAGEPEKPEVLFTHFCAIKNVLDNELIYSDQKVQTGEFNRRVFNEALEFFTGHGFMETVDDRVVPNKHGLRTARLFAGSLLDFVDSYYILSRTLWQSRKKEYIDKEWVKKAMKKGKRLLSTGEIRRAEAVHKNILESGLRYLRAKNICEFVPEPDESTKGSPPIRVKDFTRLQDLMETIKPFVEM